MQAHPRDTRPRNRRACVGISVFSTIALLYTGIALIARALPLPNNFVLVLAVSSPYATLAAMSALVVSVLSRQVRMSMLAVVVLVGALVAQVPTYYFGRPAHVGPHIEIRVLSSNLRRGQADASSFVSLAKASSDVVAVSELTPDSVNRFARAGIFEVFRHSLLIPAPGAGGIGLWSRFPLTAESTSSMRTMAAARISIPGARFEPLVASVHVISPVAYSGSSFDEWRRVIAGLKTEMTHFADLAGQAAVIVAGDFNSTPDMRQFRELLTNGYRDAVAQTGAGFAPTFPSKSWLPPLLMIDHVLTRQAGVTSIRTVHIPGSDHRALLATVIVPRE